MRSAAVQVLGGAFLASCGTLMQPGPFLLPVESLPSGATVVYEGREMGITPCLVPLRRGSSSIELRRDGYRAQPVDVGVVKNPWVSGNVLTFGLGMYVDKAFGAQWQPDVRPVEVVLVEGPGPARRPWVRVAGGGEIWNGESSVLRWRQPSPARKAEGVGGGIGKLLVSLLMRALIAGLSR